MSAKKDMNRLRERLERYGKIIRQSGHIILEFYEDCVLNPAIRRITFPSSPSDINAVHQKKRDIAKVVGAEVLEQMISGRFVRPSFRRGPVPVPTPQLEAPKPYVLNTQLPMPVELPHDDFDWKSVAIVREFDSLPIDQHANPYRAAIRTVFNEHLTAANLMKKRLAENKEMMASLQALIEADQEAYARAYVLLEGLENTDRQFDRLPPMSTRKLAFHISAEAIPDYAEAAPEPMPEPEADGTRHRAPRPSAEEMATLKKHLMHILHHAGTHGMTLVDMTDKLAAEGIVVKYNRVASAVNNAIMNQDPQLTVERVGRGTYRAVAAAERKVG